MDTKITWINHASYVIENGDICLLIDPWIDGTAFNNGWLHISNSYFPDELADKVTHIWFSHEHPDHFSPKNLKEISEKCSIMPKVLFQDTKDKRVLKFVEKIGFECIELKPFERFSLKENFVVTVVTCPPIDSSLILEIDDYKIVNTNDCIFADSSLDMFGKFVNNSCDLLLTQFSYASWIGTPNDPNLRQLAVQEKINQISRQINVFKPKYTIPFASFVWFCHEENFYMNDEMADLNNVEQFINKCKSEPVVLYPGDCWKLFEKNNFKNEQNIEKYKLDIEKSVKKEKVLKTQLTELNELEKNALTYFNRIKDKNGKYLLGFICLLAKIIDILPISKKLGFGGVSFKIKDYDITYKFDWIFGLKKTKIENPDIMISAESANFIFKFEFGIGSIRVNGRAVYRDLAGLWNFNRTLALGLINSVGDTFLTYSIKKMRNQVQDAIHDVEPSYLTSPSSYTEID